MVAHPTRVKSPSTDSLNRTRQTIHTLEIFAAGFNTSEVDSDDEVVVRLNGRIIRRMTKWAAERAGLIDGEY